MRFTNDLTFYFVRNFVNLSKKGDEASKLREINLILFLDEDVGQVCD